MSRQQKDRRKNDRPPRERDPALPGSAGPCHHAPDSPAEQLYFAYILRPSSSFGHAPLKASGKEALHGSRHRRRMETAASGTGTLRPEAFFVPRHAGESRPAGHLPFRLCPEYAGKSWHRPRFPCAACLSAECAEKAGLPEPPPASAFHPGTKPGIPFRTAEDRPGRPGRSGRSGRSGSSGRSRRP